MDNAPEENKQKKKTNDGNFRIIFMICAILAILFLAASAIVFRLNNSKFYLCVILFAVIGMWSVIFYIMMKSADERKREKESEDMAKVLQAMFELTRKNQAESDAKMQEMSENYAVPAEEIINAIKALAKVTIGRTKENAEALMNSNSLLASKIADMQSEIQSLTGNSDDTAESSQDKAPVIQGNRASDDQIRKLYNSIDDVLHELKRMDADIERLEQSQKALVEKPPVIFAGSMISGTIPQQSGNSVISPQQSVSSVTPLQQSESSVTSTEQAASSAASSQQSVSSVTPPEQSDYSDTPLQQAPELEGAEAGEPEENSDDLDLDIGSDSSDISLDEDVSTDDDLNIDGVEDDLETDTSSDEDLNIDGENELETETSTDEDLNIDAGEDELDLDTDNLSLDTDTDEGELNLDSGLSENDDFTEETRADDDLGLDVDSSINEEAEPSSEPEPLSESAPEPASESETEPEPSSESAPEPEPSSESAPEPAPEPAPEVKSEPIPDDPNAKLTPDQIASLFAAANGGGSESDGKTDDAAAEAEAEPSPEPSSESAPEPEPEVKSEPIPDDPNAKLTPDQIASLFAAANGGGNDSDEKTDDAAPEPEPSFEPETATEPEQSPEPEAEPEPEPAPEVKSEPIPDDPNAKLTPDQIASLFAAANGGGSDSDEKPEDTASESETESEPKPSSEPEAKPAPQVSGDPNRMMTPEEIEALFSKVK
ncbi:MAG: hypothetical protein ACI4CS_09675 [Candidatus Weimeria sp.]